MSVPVNAGDVENQVLTVWHSTVAGRGGSQRGGHQCRHGGCHDNKAGEVRTSRAPVSGRHPRGDTLTSGTAEVRDESDRNGQIQYGDCEERQRSQQVLPAHLLPGQNDERWPGEYGQERDRQSRPGPDDPSAVQEPDCPGEVRESPSHEGGSWNDPSTRPDGRLDETRPKRHQGEDEASEGCLISHSGARHHIRMSAGTF